MRITEIKEYPVGLLETIGKRAGNSQRVMEMGQISYADLSDDQMRGLETVLLQLKERGTACTSLPLQRPADIP